MKLGTESKSKMRYQIRISATGGFLTLSGLQSTAKDNNVKVVDSEMSRVCCLEMIDAMFK